MAYRIYPSIGIARAGNDLTQFYIGPEIPGHPGFDVDAAGNETRVEHYKVDEDQIKRQAARFRLFEDSGPGGAWREAQLPAGATVEWTVHLVNKKGAIKRTGSPQPLPKRPELISNPAAFLIDPGPRSVSGANTSGVKFDTGEYQGRRVPLGELRTDNNQNLLVLGGFGFSSSPTNATLQDFYTNPGWHDDLSDGPVTARIRPAKGSAVDAVSAWVIVGTPDYAPEIQTVVSFYDIIRQVAIDDLGVPAPTQVSFTNDVFPILLRTRRLRWVNSNSNWSDISDNWAALADASSSAAQLRSDHVDTVRQIEAILHSYRLTDLQNTILDEWAAGNFQSDWNGIPQPGNTVTADGMTRAALQSAVGQGFFPGIEVGILVTDPTIYANPFDFRLDHAQVSAGDMTAQMAVPWQADFNDCGFNWWPSQRPNNVRIDANATNQNSLGPRCHDPPRHGPQLFQACLHHGAEGCRGQRRVCRRPAGTADKLTEHFAARARRARHRRRSGRERVCDPAGARWCARRTRRGERFLPLSHRRDDRARGPAYAVGAWC